MMKMWKGCLAMLGVLTLASGAHAEFYQYRDADGRVVFTDDLSRLPEKEREKVLRFQSMTSDTAKAEKEAAPETEAVEKSASSSPGLQEEVAALEAEKKALGEEFARLQALQTRLAGRVADLAKADAKTVAAHNEEVAAFEAAREAYGKRRAKYNADVQAFNARVQEKEKNNKDGKTEGESQEAQAP